MTRFILKAIQTELFVLSNNVHHFECHLTSSIVGGTAVKFLLTHATVSCTVSHTHNFGHLAECAPGIPSINNAITGQKETYDLNICIGEEQYL